MKLVVLLVTVGCLVSFIDAKQFLACELAKEFSKNDMERYLIPHWICLVLAESQGNTSKTVDLPNMSTNYGIFQVNEFQISS